LVAMSPHPMQVGGVIDYDIFLDGEI